MEVSSKTLKRPGAFLRGSTVPLPLRAEITGRGPDQGGENPSILMLVRGGDKCEIMTFSVQWLPGGGALMGNFDVSH